MIFKQNKNRMESRYYAGLATSTLSYWVKSVYIVTAGAIDTVVTLSFFKKTFTITIWCKSWKILNKTQGLSESVICWASTAVAQRTKRLMTLGVLPCVAPAAAELDGRMLTESHWTVEAWLFFFPYTTAHSLLFFSYSVERERPTNEGENAKGI